MKPTLYFGECIEVMETFPSKSIDLILCDLPYGTTQCAWDSVIPMEKLWTQYKRIIKPRCGIVLTCSQPFTSRLVYSNIYDFKYELIWNKRKGTQPGLAKIQPMKSHENILVFGKGRIKYNPQMEEGDPYFRDNKGYQGENHHKMGLGPIVQDNKGERFPQSILTFPRDWSAQTKLHPTQKPVDLMRYLIRTYSNPGDAVLDNTMGSGTTGIACIREGRNFIGIENDADYFNIAQKRIKNLLSLTSQV